MQKIKVLAAANAMKGSLSAYNTSCAMAKGAKEATDSFSRIHDFPITAEIVVKPIADGGDDTLDVIAEKTYEREVVGPLGKSVTAKWGSLGETAVVELTKASGIALVNPDELDPFKATTYGTGELILAAIEDGYKKILITIGGSATVDGGIGALAALGAKFYDSDNKEIRCYGNEALGQVSRVDFSVFEKYKNVEFSFACDVDNVLLGDKGAAAVFGPQKLAPKIRENPELLKECVLKMDANMARFAKSVQEATGIDTTQIVGSGAAGGFVVGFVAALNATLKPGSEFILNLLGFDYLKDIDITFTSEGMCDKSTLNNKAPYALTKRMGKFSHVVILTGAIQNEEVEQALYSAGASLVQPIQDRTMTLAESMSNTENLIRRASFRATFAYLSSLALHK